MEHLTKKQFLSILLIIIAIAVAISLAGWKITEEDHLVSAGMLGKYVVAPIGIIAIPAIILYILHYYLWYLPQKAVRYLKR